MEDNPIRSIGAQEAKSQELRKIIKQLYETTAKLESMYPRRHFTPDGHMVGSLGEVVAASTYDLELFKASNPLHDAVSRKDGRLVQIKATQGNRITISEKPDYLIALKLNRDGSFDEVYNGPGSPVWTHAGKPAKTGQRFISLSKLALLNEEVSPSDRI